MSYSRKTTTYNTNDDSPRCASPHRICSKHTMLRFEPDADIAFKVLYADLKLSEWLFFTTDQKIATLSHARNVLADALQTFSNHQLQHMWTDAVEALQTKIHTALNDTRFAVVVKDRLVEYQTREEFFSTSCAVEEWHDDALAFLQHVETLRELDLESDVQLAHDVIEQRYRQFVAASLPDAIVDDTSLVGDRYSMDDEQIRTINQYLPLMGLEVPQTQASILKRFEGLFQVYEALGVVMDDQESYQSNSFIPTELAAALETIQTELLYLLGAYVSESSLKDQFLRFKPIEVLCQGACYALVSKGRKVVHTMLADYLHKIHLMISTELYDSLGEADFIRLASFVSAFSLAIPVGVSEIDWKKFAPSMLTSSEVRSFSNKLQILYAAFQNKTYNTNELSQLWLAIWRGLKATYLIVRRNNFKLPTQDFPAETTFFSRVSVRNQFELVLSSPEPLNHVVVDNIVGEYCILIAEFHKLLHHESSMPRKFELGSVHTQIFDDIYAYADDRRWNDVVVRGVQKCATRLNHLNNGPAFIRRTRSGSMLAPIPPAPQWILDRVVLQGDESVPLSPPAMKRAMVLPHWDSEKSSAPLRQRPIFAARSRSSITDIRSAANPFDRQANNSRILTAADSDEEPEAGSDDNTVDDGLHSIDVVSAFDYVLYPFPETRALEVAQSRQISRDLSTPGIFSQGALEQDVINRPPRHTWPPGRISVWATFLPIDPINVVRELWSELRHSRPAPRRLQRARSRPSITSRRPRKQWAEEHPKLKPLRDLKRRVAKTKKKAAPVPSTTKDANFSNTHLPKLSGGGPGQNNNNGRPSSAPPSVGPIVPPSAMNTRTQQLMDRMRGIWRGTRLPSTSLIRQHFLAPNNWDVDAAYQAARRFVNYGLLDGMSDTDSDLANNSGDSPISNPFLAGGVTRGLGLNPLQFGVPITRNTPVVSSDNQLPNSTSITPTPQVQPQVLTRISQYLQPVLPAHQIPAQAQSLGSQATNSQNAFSPSGLPAPFQIYEDSPSPPTAVPQSPSGRIFAPNQQHQAQLDRTNLGLPSHRSSDNSSNQENTTPITQRTPSMSSSPPAPVRMGPVCNNVTCHACPQYAGQYHHICAGQEGGLGRITNAPPQIPSPLGRPISDSENSHQSNPFRPISEPSPFDSFLDRSQATRVNTATGNRNPSASPILDQPNRAAGLFGTNGHKHNAGITLDMGNRSTSLPPSLNPSSSQFIGPFNLRPFFPPTIYLGNSPLDTRHINNATNPTPTSNNPTSQTLIPSTPSQPVISSTNTSQPISAAPNNGLNTGGQNSSNGVPLVNAPTTPTPATMPALTTRGNGRGRGRGQGRNQTTIVPPLSTRGGRLGGVTTATGVDRTTIPGIASSATAAPATTTPTTATLTTPATNPSTGEPLRRSTRSTRGQRRH